MRQLSIKTVDTKMLRSLSDMELISLSDKVGELFKRKFEGNDKKSVNDIDRSCVLKVKSEIRKEAKARESTVVQTLILSRARFKTVAAASKWIKDHGFKVHKKPDVTKDSYRFRQIQPNRFKKGSFRTIRLTDGVKAVIGRLKEERAKTVKFLPIEKKKADEQIVFGVVLEPGVIDSQKDKISAKEIANAAHIWLAKFQTRGFMHKEVANHKIEIYESYIAPVDLTINGKNIKKGSWLLMLHILDAQMWKDIKAKKLTGLSIGGTARRVPVKTKRLALNEIRLGKLAA